MASCAKNTIILKLFLVLAALAEIFFAAPRQYEIKCQEDRVNTPAARGAIDGTHDVPHDVPLDVPSKVRFSCLHSP